MTRDWQRRYRNGFKCKFERDIMYARNTTKMHNAQCFFGAPQQNARSRAAFLVPRLPALHACLHFALACKSVTLCTCTFGSSSRSQVHDVTCHVRGELLSAGCRHPPPAPPPPRTQLLLPAARSRACMCVRARWRVCAWACACARLCVTNKRIKLLRIQQPCHPQWMLCARRMCERCLALVGWGLQGFAKTLEVGGSESSL